MDCVAPSAQNWRDQVENWSDEQCKFELRRAWHGPTYIPPDRRHQDWTNFRAATLREARKRGLNLSVTGLGT